MPESDLSTPAHSVARRHFLAGMLGSGAALAAVGAGGTTAASAATVAKLPGEISRLANQATNLRKTLYDNVEVNIQGDKARIFIPQSVTPGQTKQIAVVWFYHGAGSDHNAMNGGFKWNAEYAVDGGAIAICQSAGGTQYANAVARTAQANGWAYMNSLVKVGVNYLRATSGGGVLGSWVYANQAIPRINGLYMVNGLFDLEKALSGKAGGSILLAYNNDTAAIVATNPARSAPSAWSRANLRVIVSDDTNPDLTVPPADHGLALIAKAQPVAREATVETHALGHDTPSWTNTDSVQSFQRWQTAGM